MKVDINSLSQMNGLIDKSKNDKPAKGFAKILSEAIEKTSDLEKDSNKITNDFLTGKVDNIHEVMIVAQKAEIAMSFAIEVRNRVLEGYQEFARMQI